MKITKKQLQKLVTEHIGASLNEMEGPFQPGLGGGTDDSHEQKMDEFVNFLMKAMIKAEKDAESGGSKNKTSINAGRYDAYRKTAEEFQRLFG